jgi:hypothetical protein
MLQPVGMRSAIRRAREKRWIKAAPQQRHRNMSSIAHDHYGYKAHGADSESATGFIKDLLNTAFLIAASGSLANLAMAQGSVGDKARSIGSYLPPSRANLSAALSSLISSDSRERLQNLEENMRFVSELSRLEASTGADAPDLMVFAYSWRRIASQARTLLERLINELASYLPDAVLANARMAGRLLTAIASGGWPCFDESGEIQLPVPVERRGDQRAQSGRCVHLEVNDSIQRAVAENVSSHGLGLFGLTDVEIGNVVYLMLAPGSRQEGRVVWVQDHQAGIRFDRPLPTSLHQGLIR